MKKIFASLLIAVCALCGCKKDDTIRYNNLTMANIVDGSLVSDQGNTFDIVESDNEVKLESFEYGRVILLCDVLKKTADMRYDIRLWGIGSVLTKEPLLASTIKSDSEASVSHPISICDVWYSGGYINMFVEFAAKEQNSTQHLINLIYEENTYNEEDGKKKNYTLTLRHNAYEDRPTSEEDEDYSFVGAYVSFPIANIIDGDQASMTLNWDSYQKVDGELSKTSWIAQSRTFEWKRSGYEHPQKSIAATPAAVLMK